MKKRFLGLTFIFISLAITLTNVAITGAVTGTTKSNSLSIIAISFLLIGSIIFLSERKKIQSKIEELVKAGVPKENIEKIQEGVKSEYKRLSKEKRKDIYNEIAEVLEDFNKENKRAGGEYDIHKLSTPPSGIRSDAPKNTYEADAKVLNRLINQGGRGTERYIIDGDTGKVVGIAYHPGGNPRELKWRVKF